MDVMPRPKQQDQSQDSPLHRTPPAGANLTNARTGGMVRHYAAGVATVSGDTTSSPPPHPAYNPPAALWAVPPAPAPGTSVGRFRVPTSPLGAALSIAAGQTPPPAVPAANVAVPPPAPSYIAQAAGLAPQRGSPQHAMNTPHEYSLEDFLHATEGMSQRSFYKMMALTHQRTMQENAAGLALSTALQHQSPENILAYLKALSVPGLGSPYFGGSASSGFDNSFVGGQGAVPPNGE